MANFNAWTEVDPNAHLSHSWDRASWTNLIRNEAAYLHRSIALDDFSYNFEFKVSSIDVNADGTNNFLLYLIYFCETAGRPYYTEIGEGFGIAILEDGDSTTEFQLYLQNSGDDVQDTSTNLTVGTIYYCKLVRSGAAITFTIYSDPARSVTVDTLTITLPSADNITLSVWEVTASVDSSSDGNDQCDGWIENIRAAYTGDPGGHGEGCGFGLPTIDLVIGGVTIIDQTILQLSLHLGITREVSSFEAIIDRGNPTYDNELDPGEANVLTNGDAVTVSIGRDPNTPLLLTGKLEEIEYEDEVEEYEFKNIVRVRGRCEGWQLFARKFDGDLITLVGTGDANYTRASGSAESLVAYIIDNYTTLSHIRQETTLSVNANSGQKDATVTNVSYFTVGDLVKIYDDNAWEYNEIASIAGDVLTMVSDLNHTYVAASGGNVGLDLIRATDTAYTEMTYTRTTIFEILKFICDTADDSGVIGYDMIRHEDRIRW